MQNAENKMKNIAGVITNSRFLLFVDKSSKISIADILDKLKSEQEKKMFKSVRNQNPRLSRGF